MIPRLKTITDATLLFYFDCPTIMTQLLFIAAIINTEVKCLKNLEFGLKSRNKLQQF